MTKTRLLLAALLAQLLLAAGCGNEIKAGLRETAGGLLSGILTDIAQPQNVKYMLSLKGNEARLDFVADIAGSKLDKLAVQLYNASEKGDTAQLREWAAEYLPSIIPLLDEYSPRQILRTVDRIDPHYAAAIRSSVPKALAYLFSEGRIEQPTLEALVSRYKAGRFDFTEQDAQMFADLLIEQWELSAEGIQVGD